MHRLFVAIHLPRALRTLLSSSMGGIFGARWQDDAQLHLTLRFIGEVDRHQAEDIAAALGTIRHPRFAIALRGVGRFAAQRRTNLVWAGIAPAEPVQALHRKVDQAIIRSGLPADGRAYHPHVTLARFARGASPDVEGYLAAHAALSSAPEPIEDFRLYESILAREGATYHVVERYPLT